MAQINREDMLELTRRMTPSRTHFTRIAGAYMDEEGQVDGTFNTSFRGLPLSEKELTLAIAKEVVFAQTNTRLMQYKIPGIRPGSFWQFFLGLCECDLKNDALLLNLYEMIGEQYPKGQPYAIYVYHGVYDVPIKTSDHQQTFESEEVYSYLIITVCSVVGKNELGKPECGILYPAFTNRSADLLHVNVYDRSDDGFFEEFLKL